MKHILAAMAICLSATVFSQFTKTYCTESGLSFTGKVVYEDDFKLSILGADSAVFALQKSSLINCDKTQLKNLSKDNPELLKGTILLCASTASIVAGTTLMALAPKHNSDAMRFGGLSLNSVSLILNAGTIINLIHLSKNKKTAFNF